MIFFSTQATSGVLAIRARPMHWDFVPRGAPFFRANDLLSVIGQ
jgi:hypothetical protein